MTYGRLCLLLYITHSVSSHNNKLKQVLSWKQVDYDFNGVFYNRDASIQRTPDAVYFDQEVGDSEKFFIQYNNVPIGFEKYGDKVFVTVPRRRHGIPSTLNYVLLSDSKPILRPYPGVGAVDDLVSVYRPRRDVCNRLWMVDTGLLEIPDSRIQVRKPSIIVYDLKTDKRILKYELKESDLVNERTPGGLTSITVDVSKHSCNDAYAYINDLATAGLIVFSMKKMNSWRIQDPSFMFDEASLNFTVAGHVISWRDSIFSIALSKDRSGRTTAYYHPLVSTKEYAIDTGFLKNNSFSGNNVLLGERGPSTQSGSHDFHFSSGTMLFANVAQDAILCWNVHNKMSPENIGIAAQDHEKLVYISDLKVIGDDVWVLVNQIPRFVFSKLNVGETNYFIHRASVKDLLMGTVCEQ